jgi:hypothetical protein
MPKQTDRLDTVHNRAICREIAKRLRASLSNDPSRMPAVLERQLDQLRELEEQFPSIVLSMQDDRI